MICYQYRLYPNREQVALLWKHANKLNSLYNYFLNQRNIVYDTYNIPVTRYDQQAELVRLKKIDPELKDIYSQVLQQVPLRLDNTFKAFFRKDNEDQGYPRFRSCRNFFSICYPQSGFTIADNIFTTTAYGDIKFYKHRPYNGKIKQVTITCDSRNRFYISITVDVILRKPYTRKVIGIDVGITNLVATNTGDIIKNKTHAKYFDKQIDKLKSRRDKQYKKGSREYIRLSRTINRLYEMKNRKVTDYLHKISKNLTSKYDTIFCEDLSLKRMSESNITGLNRGLRNSGLSTFISYLNYKSKQLIKVNPRNTSKTCNRCGNIIDMPLHKRTYQCTCGYVEDRDINAAKNIHCLGQAILNGYTEITLQEALTFR
jgi:putative transposase